MPGIAIYPAEGTCSGLTLGVASSSSREWVVGHLDQLDVTNLFDAIVTESVVQAGVA
jgi:beta-phosphoglucomutase-like phosphatase (HAD superfamily)